MNKLALYIGNKEGYVSTFCPQESLQETALAIAERLKMGQDRTQELLAALLSGDMAAGISIRRDDLTLHCSYSNEYLEMAAKRLKDNRR